MLSFVMLVIGFVLLVWGADKFVEGASALARKMGVSPLLVGLTIVAFGTSMPELAVSVTAALRGANEIAVGNVVGSNMFNLLVVAGLSAVICPLVMDKMLLRRDWPLSIFAAVLLLVAIAPDHVIARWEGAVLLVIFAVILSRQIKAALNDRAQLAAAEAEAAEEAAEMTKSPVMIWVNIVLGLACIVLGGQLAVNGATGIARMFGLSETLIGLTIVAIGTSLPELVTSIVAARKGQNEIAMGNVIGSNLFNILLILGVSAVITPIPVQATSITDCLFLIAISVVFYLPARKGKLGRLPGAVMAAMYVVYTAYLIMR
ncbi:sodium:calcium antiporter [Butyricicoccus sp. AM42-5AC]|jgi:cation:H+ antiporter|nr:sodium:calcium antiporter [Butyricicoccus sp. AM42-5AC]